MTDTRPARAAAYTTFHLDPPAQDIEDRAHALATDVEAITRATPVGTSYENDGTAITLTLALDYGTGSTRPALRTLADLTGHLASTLDLAAAEQDTTLASLEVLTMAEVNRRLATRGVPAPGRATGGPVAMADLPRALSTREFAELLGRTPARVRQLRDERAAAVAEGRDHPFPAEALPGYWLQADAEAYRAHQDARERRAG